jgi:hypothetical protein
MIRQGQQQALELFQNIAKRLDSKLKTPIRTFFIPLIIGALLAIVMRRTVTKWIQAAGLSEKYRNIFYHMPDIGRNGQKLFDEIIKYIKEHLGDVLKTATRIRIVLDDTPTKRYGPKIEGAGYHHNPTPGKTDAKLCFGHSWVVATLAITHPLFGEISFPIAAELYLRQKEVDKLKPKSDRQFKTKMTIAVEMIKHLVPKFKAFGKKIKIIVDGGYANESVLSPLDKLDDVIVVTRFRRDVALFEIPEQPAVRGRGRPRKYGKQIDVKSLVESPDGWEEIECRQYGRVVTKRVKSFIATSRITRGKPIKVVIVKEDDKTWVPLISTDVDVSVLDILESYAVRFGIEEMVKDLKEVWGWGKQELRLLESNGGAATMNMLLFGMTELATWDRSHGELVDRSCSPWDDADRRPSHADRRNYLRRAVLAKELNDALHWKAIPTKIRQTLEKLMRIAA